MKFYFIPSIYVSIKSPEARQAAYLDGQQIQITWVEKYFRRPSELEKMGILTFFSYYNIKNLGVTNGRLIQHMKNIANENYEEYLNPPIRPFRPKNTCRPASNWEDENLTPR